MTQNSQSVLLELVAKQYTGDALSFEKPIFERGMKPISVEEATPVTPASEIQTTETVAPAVMENENKRITKEEAVEIRRAQKEYEAALAHIKDVIAPSMIKVDAKGLQIGETYVRSVFTYAYPDFLEGNWLSPLINWDVKFDMSMFVYPIDGAFVMKYLKKRLTELNSERAINMDKGLLSDPALDAQIQDVEELRASLTRGQEKYFHFSIYITVYGEDEEQMKKLSNTLDTLLSGRNILTKQAFLRSEQAFIATGPFARDEVGVYRNISTKGLSTTFPFTSSSLSQDDGILYGINTHNNSLIIFDRFKTENANMVVFAKSG